MPCYDFKYKSVLESEEQMYNDIQAVLTENTITGELRRHFSLAVSEGFVNALIHGNQFDPCKNISIHLDIKEEALVADIVDEGERGLERIQQRRSRGELADGGRGINLMGHICDHVKFARSDKGGLKLSISFIRQKINNRKNTFSYQEDAMELAVRHEGNVAVIDLKGRLDLSGGTTLKETTKGLADEGKLSIHVNLTDVDFINSSGLGAMVSIMKEVRLRQGRLTLSNLANYVQEIFEITQLSHIFEVYATEQEALGSYQSVPSN